MTVPVKNAIGAFISGSQNKPKTRTISTTQAACIDELNLFTKQNRFENRIHRMSNINYGPFNSQQRWLGRYLNESSQAKCLLEETNNVAQATSSNLKCSLLSAIRCSLSSRSTAKRSIDSADNDTSSDETATLACDSMYTNISRYTTPPTLNSMNIISPLKPTVLPAFVGEFAPLKHLPSQFPTSARLGLSNALSSPVPPSSIPNLRKLNLTLDPPLQCRRTTATPYPVLPFVCPNLPVPVPFGLQVSSSSIAPLIFQLGNDHCTLNQILKHKRIAFVPPPSTRHDSIRCLAPVCGPSLVRDSASVCGAMTTLQPSSCPQLMPIPRLLGILSVLPPPNLLTNVQRGKIPIRAEQVTERRIHTRAYTGSHTVHTATPTASAPTVLPPDAPVSKVDVIPVDSPVSLPPPPPPPPPAPTGINISVSAPNPPPMVQTRRLQILTQIPKPNRKLKQLFWDGFFDYDIPEFWKNTNVVSIVNQFETNGTFKELETWFAAKEPIQMKTRKKVLSDKITFLPHNLSHQFGISLHNFSTLTAEELVSKILRCDKDVIENSAVVGFLGNEDVIDIPIHLHTKFRPFSTDYTREVDNSIQPTQNPEVLQRNDRIYLELIYNLRHYWKARIQGLQLVANWRKDFNDLDGKLSLIEKAVKCIRASIHLKTVCHVIFVIGNYMNDKPRQSGGFRLSSFDRFGSLRDDTNFPFLHRIESIIRKQFPEALDLIDEMSEMQEISRYSIEEIVLECKDFCAMVENVVQSLEIGSLSDSSKLHPEDCIKDVIGSILSRAKLRSSILTRKLNETMTELRDLVRLFGEDDNDDRVVDSFIGKFVRFGGDLKKAHEENLTREMKEKGHKVLQEMFKRVKEKKKLNEDTTSTGVIADTGC